MRNDSEGIDVGTTTEVDEPSEAAGGVVSEEDEACVLPSGSRTLDKRLNPEAPDFVPGVTNRLLAAKIVDELVGYTRWSNAAGEDISYGARYDGIWSESCIQSQTEAQLDLAASAGHDVTGMQQLPNIIETVGDLDRQPSMKKKRSKSHNQYEVEPGAETTPTGRCCACEIM
ncbi:uncharacterized protein [Drosophila virilis]|uniref:Uncharacterized protein n=1 Tax=Drosophila virilis TaxID=7244 RepID=B4MDF7_DROVI|nr:uncharacterized protein LOC6635723 [Drosophila virilis]XP_032294724.1 uncharacterized protein LOC6635723 [Drosophila virilis]EDW71218.1 uncharacterized protein Dvir_GJ16243 [Drosophila virilis]